LFIEHILMLELVVLDCAINATWVRHTIAASTLLDGQAGAGAAYRLETLAAP
jgi:hypothetical protein